MRADTFAGQVIAVLSRRASAFELAPAEPQTFPGRVRAFLSRRRTERTSPSFDAGQVSADEELCSQAVDMTELLPGEHVTLTGQQPLEAAGDIIDVSAPKKMNRDLMVEVMPRIIDAAAAYGQSSDTRELAYIDNWFDAERQRIEGALIKAKTGWEIAHRRLADAKAQVGRCEREAYAADQRGSHGLAIDYLKERQQALAVVQEYESLLPELESDLNELTEGRQVLESEYGKLRQKVLALHQRQESEEALAELKDGLRNLQTADEALRDAQERVDNNMAQLKLREQ